MIRLVTGTRLCVPHLAFILMWATKGWFECHINAPGVCCVNIYTIVQYPNTFAILTIYCTRNQTSHLIYFIVVVQIVSYDLHK